MDNCDAGNCIERILSGNLKNTSAVTRLFRQIVAGVQYLHNQRIAHGDRTPENMRVTSTSDGKILDFWYWKEKKGI
jgi:serine/threonine protein kinase